MQADELNEALRAAGTIHPPVKPHSAFELFSRAQPAKSTDKSNAEVLCAWNSAKALTKRKYEEVAQQEQEQYDQTHAAHQHTERVLKKVYAVELAKDDEHTRTTAFVQGVGLRLRTMDLQEAYQKRVTKIKITVQFVQICLRLSATYRFPLPPLTIQFLDGIKFLEYLDIAQVPMNVDCYRHLSYIDKVYVHTTMCLAIMLVLKPEVVLAVLIAPWRCVTRSACGDWLTKLPCAQWAMSLFSNAAGSQRQSKVVVQLLSRKMKEISSLGSSRLSEQLLKQTMNGEDPKENRDSALAPAVDSRAKLDRASAAMVLQRLWRHRKPRVLAAQRSITVLRRNVLSFVSNAKHLGREDFLLLFSYAVYSALCDTCFMYFDCSEVSAIHERGAIHFAAQFSHLFRNSWQLLFAQVFLYAAQTVADVFLYSSLYIIYSTRMGRSTLPLMSGTTHAPCSTASQPCLA
jgi:hypothetical protein